jgi:hypothetical protein
MFPPSRPFRQVLATLVLAVLTLVPTALVVELAWRINRPGHLRDVEIELGRQLGLQVTLEGVHYPRPGEAIYRGIVLRQDEPRGKGLAEVARAELVRVHRADRELTLQLENPQLRGESPRLVLEQLAALIQRSGQIAFERIDVAAPSCQIDLGRKDLEFTVREVAGEFLADPSMPVLTFACDMPGRGPEGGTRCELTLARDRRTEPMETSLSLKTVDGRPLSARVLNVFFDAEDWLGSDATVEGLLRLRQAGSGAWEADFQGSLLDVDLSRLVGRHFPRHRLAGRAQVTIQMARWGERPNQGLGWLDVSGKLFAGQGSIGIDLLRALSKEMRFQLSPRIAQLDPRKSEVEFRALGLAFTVHANGEIEIAGGLGDEFAPDAVIAGATTPLVSAPQGTASVHGLIKTLCPVGETDPGVVVPLTSESRVLLSLPVPPQPPLNARRSIDGN